MTYITPILKVRNHWFRELANQFV